MTSEYLVLEDDSNSNLQLAHVDNTNSKQNRLQYTLYITDTDKPDNFVLEAPLDIHRDKPWSYESGNKTLTDHLAHSIIIPEPLDVLRTTNLFSDLHEVMKAHFEPKDNLKDKISNFIKLITVERQQTINNQRGTQIKNLNSRNQELTTDIHGAKTSAGLWRSKSKKLTGELFNVNTVVEKNESEIDGLETDKHGAQTSAGIWYCKTEKLREALSVIQDIVENKQDVSGYIQKDIRKVIESTGISDYAVFKEIDEILSSDYHIPKRTKILRIIDNL